MTNAGRIKLHYIDISTTTKHMTELATKKSLFSDSQYLQSIFSKVNSRFLTNHAKLGSVIKIRNRMIENSCLIIIILA